MTPTIRFYHDVETDHDVVAVPVPEFGLLLILHEDTLATYRVEPWGERFVEVMPWWPPQELKAKLPVWAGRVRARGR